VLKRDFSRPREALFLCAIIRAAAAVRQRFLLRRPNTSVERYVSATLTVLLGAVGLAAATEQADSRPKWEAPGPARAVVNPLPETPDVLAEGLRLYEKNCLTCHGAKGKGDGPAIPFIESSPTDISIPEVQSRMTDGEIFWKITEGRNPMPSFKKKLSENELHTVRSLRAR
jgi:mono/diheme cytochrome c family protein